MKLKLLLLLLISSWAYAQVDRNCVYGDGYTVRHISEPIIGVNHKAVSCTNGGMACSKMTPFGMDCVDTFTKPEDKVPDLPDSLPDTPLPQGCYISSKDGNTMCPATYTVNPDDIHKAKFFTFRKSWQDPPLRTNKEVLKSKTFLLAYGGLWAAMITDITYTHGKRESWGSEAPAMAGVTLLGIVGDKYFTRSFMVGPAVYGIQHYVKDAFRGR